MYCWVKEIVGTTNVVATLRGPWVEYDTCLITAVKVKLTPRELLTANRMLGERLPWTEGGPGTFTLRSSSRVNTLGVA